MATNTDGAGFFLRLQLCIECVPGAAPQRRSRGGMRGKSILAAGSPVGAPAPQPCFLGPLCPVIVLLPPRETKRAGGDGPPLNVDTLTSPALSALRTALVDELVTLAGDREACRRALGITA